MRRLACLLLLVLASGCDETPAPVAYSGADASLPPTCPAGQSVCGSDCADLKTDSNRCGSCGTQCAETEACANGNCFPRDCTGLACEPDSVCDRGACTEKSCVGVACAEGRRCAAGSCICSEGLSDCEGACADLRADSANCGACGTACGAGERCAGGRCYPADCPNVPCAPDAICFGGACTSRSCLGVTCPAGEACDPGNGACSSCGPLDTELNCGSCGNACASGDRCVEGRCYPESCASETCLGSQVCVGERCVDKTCVGISCGADQTCANGVCACSGGLALCAGACADLASDSQHCGSCDLACGSGQRCGGGRCFDLDCPTGPCGPDELCVAGECAPVGPCGVLVTEENCGGCGNACAAGGRCVEGRCYPGNCAAETCLGSQVCVGERCVDEACVGVSCGLGQVCAGGSCGCTGGLELCGSECADVETDRQNCGSCGLACASGQSCAGGRCWSHDCGGLECGPGELCAAGKCVPSGSCGPLVTDESCGACGHACAALERCVGGLCLPVGCADTTCGPGSVCWQDACVAEACVGVVCDSAEQCDPASGACLSCGPLDTDLHCGACASSCAPEERCAAGACMPMDCPGAACTGDQVCANGACAEIACLGVSCGANEVCSGGACVCAPGTDRCGGNVCRSLASDDANCGACGQACPADQACVGGRCECAGGLSFCGATCVDLQTDPESCGACGQSCASAGGFCAGGACVCPQGLSLCGGQCVDLLSDAASCGSCGHACAIAGQQCSNGACVCPQGQVACNGACRDLSQDNLNCGTCGRVCGGTEYCSAGVCGTPFAKYSNFNLADAAGCSRLPLDGTACGERTSRRVIETVVESASPSTPKIHPVEIAPDERLEITGTVGCLSSSGAAWMANIWNYQGVSLAQASDAAYPPSNDAISLGQYGSVAACGHPTQVRLGSQIGTANYSVEIAAVTRQGANRGGTGFASATPLQLIEDSERVCDQVCGNHKTAGCDDPQYFKAVIPPNKAVAIEWMASASSTNFYVDAYDSRTALIARLVESVVFGGASGKARLLNKTSEPQTVYFVVTSSQGVSDYDVAFVTER